MSDQIVLSRYQAAPLLAAGAGGGTASTSPDLSLTHVAVVLDDTGVRFPDGTVVTWDDLREIADSENGCFRVDCDGIDENRVYSETTNWVRSLMPTAGAPTMLVSGIPMHRISGIDPYADTLRKIK